MGWFWSGALLGHAEAQSVWAGYYKTVFHLIKSWET